MFDPRSHVYCIVLGWGVLVGCANDHGDVQDVDLSDATRAELIDFAKRADTVFVGEVTNIAYQVSSPDASGLRLPFTLVTWRIDDDIKGVAAPTPVIQIALGWLTISSPPRPRNASDGSGARCRSCSHRLTSERERRRRRAPTSILLRDCARNSMRTRPRSAWQPAPARFQG